MASRNITLKPYNELRFEVFFDSTVQLVLKSGTCELFGSELAQGVSYSFTGNKLAIFTWHGAEIELSGNCQVEYVSDETPMMPLYQMCLAMEQQRLHSNGPRVLVVGTGRNSTSKIITNYAVRSGRQPIYVDLDVTNGTVLFPGTCTAVIMERVIDVEEGVPMTAPLSYYFGHIQLTKDNVKWYNKIIQQMSSILEQRIEQDSQLNASGMILIAPPWNDQLGMQVLENIITSFKVDVLLVVGNERLYSELNKKIQNIKLLKIQKSGGVVLRDPLFRRQEQMGRIRRYFYGGKGELCPYSTVFHFKDINIRQIGEGPMAPTSALPIGANRKVDESKFVRIDPKQTINHSVLAICASDDADSEESNAAFSAVLGFVCISDVDEAKARLTVLTPSPGRLPKTVFIIGSLKWIE